MLRRIAAFAVPSIANGLLVLLAACGRSASTEGLTSGRDLEEAFRRVGTIRLVEIQGDEIASIGSVVETRSARLLISDRSRPRAHLFDSTGQKIAAVGQFGDGPGEFRGINGAAELASGQFVLSDSRLGRMSVFSADLEFETVLHPNPPPFGPLVAAGDGLVAGLWAGREGARFHDVDLSGNINWSIFETPAELLRRPYWGSTARSLLAVSSSEIFVATSLHYPIESFTHAGQSVDNFGDAPPSFRPVPIVERGAFTGPGAQERIREWLDSFTVIGALAVVDDRYLVVAHARLESSATVQFDPRHYAIDVYELESRRKILQDVALPPGTRVLAGGRHLYLLLAEPPEPWTIARLDITDSR